MKEIYKELSKKKKRKILIRLLIGLLCSVFVYQEAGIITAISILLVDISFELVSIQFGLLNKYMKLTNTGLSETVDIVDGLFTAVQLLKITKQDKIMDKSLLEEVGKLTGSKI